MLCMPDFRGSTARYREAACTPYATGLRDQFHPARHVNDRDRCSLLDSSDRWLVLRGQNRSAERKLSSGSTDSGRQGNVSHCAHAADEQRDAVRVQDRRWATHRSLGDRALGRSAWIGSHGVARGNSGRRALYGDRHSPRGESCRRNHVSQYSRRRHLDPGRPIQHVRDRRHQGKLTCVALFEHAGCAAC